MLIARASAATALLWLALVTQADPRGTLLAPAALAQAGAAQAAPSSPAIAPSAPPGQVAPPGAAPGSVAGAGGGGGEIRVTTDTPEYCETLAERVARNEKARADVPPQAVELAEEGHHMCDRGLIRGGLVRLRRAWLMLRSDK